MSLFNQNKVTRIYMEEFGRPPDAPGLKYWSALFDLNQITEQQFRQELIDSPEGTMVLRQRVREVYVDTLNREGDQAGVDYWVSMIKQGTVSLDTLGDTFLQYETPSAPGEPPPDPIRDPRPDLGEATPIKAAAPFMTSEIERIMARYDVYGLGPLLEKAQREQWTDAQTMMEIEASEPWKQRFKGMEGRVNKISPEEYIQFENQAYELMKNAGFPPGFYDSKDDFADLIRAGGNPDQLAQRIRNGFERLAEVPPQVKAAFAAQQGIDNADAAIAAFIIDPTRAEAAIMKAVAQAEVAGSAALFGLNVDPERARQLAERGFNLANTQQTFQALAEQRSIFDETITEQVDLSADVEGVNAAFGIDSMAGRAIEDRVADRRGQLAGGGGAIITERGLAGRADR